MRMFRPMRWLVQILLLLNLTLTSCSSTQQGASQQEELAANQQAEGDQGNAEEGNAATNNEENASAQQGDKSAQANAAEEGNAPAEGDQFTNNLAGGNANAAEEGGNAALGEPQAQGDLQEIIDEMNQTAGGNAANPGVAGNQAAAAPAGNAVQGAPMNAASTPPSTQAVGAGLPEKGSKMSYVVQKGDTLGQIATRIYGDRSKWREIAEFTGLANPQLIYPGDVVYYQLTDQSMGFAAAYETAPRQAVEVMAGDTLSTIAARVLGSSSNWKSIWRENDNIDNPDQLTPGTKLFYMAPFTLTAAAVAKDVNIVKIDEQGIGTSSSIDTMSDVGTEIVNSVTKNLSQSKLMAKSVAQGTVLRI